MRSDDALEELIDRITVDANGNEGYWSFLQAFEDDLDFPVPATLAGAPITITGIDFAGNERRGLVATIERNRHAATISILDIELPGTAQVAAQLIAAYRRWLGID